MDINLNFLDLSDRMLVSGLINMGLGAAFFLGGAEIVVFGSLATVGFIAMGNVLLVSGLAARMMTTNDQRALFDAVRQANDAVKGTLNPVDTAKDWLAERISQLDGDQVVKTINDSAPPGGGDIDHPPTTEYNSWHDFAKEALENVLDKGADTLLESDVNPKAGSQRQSVGLKETKATEMEYGMCLPASDWAGKGMERTTSPDDDHPMCKDPEPISVRQP